MNFPDRETEIGKSINEYLKNKNDLNDQSIHLLFSANRWEKDKFIKTSLKQGQNIVCGRYAYSGVAYSNAKGLDLEWCKHPDKGLTKPDLVIFLDIDIDSASKRSQYGEEKYEKKEFQKKVLDSFKKIFEKEKCFIIDASQSIEKIHENICDLFEMTLKDSQDKDIGSLFE